MSKLAKPRLLENRLNSLWIVTLLMCFSSFADTSIVEGEDGDPGVPEVQNGMGGDGESVSAVANDSSEPLVLARSVGGAGGYGADGVDGSVDIPQGADAGNGGHGGSAYSLALTADESSMPRVIALSFGGNGGDGGRGGSGYLSAEDGSGGYGGDGGNSRAVAQLTNNALVSSSQNEVVMFTRGGRGGRGYGLERQGGNGGNAYIELDAQLGSINGAGIPMDLEVVGGAGGLGTDGAHAGHGGRALVGPIRVNGQPNVGTRITLVAEGGRGGDSIGSGDGGDGAEVDLQNAMEFTGDFVNIIQAAAGGDGGSTRGGLAGEAGSGQSLLEYVDTSTADSIRLLTNARGGDGGDQQSETGTAGDGANARALTSLTTTRQFAEVRAFSNGGRGGDASLGATSGSGGNASSHAILNIGSLTSSGNGTAEADARAGAAGEGSDADNLNGQNGSDAVATAQANGVGSSNVLAISRASAGLGGRVDNSDGTGSGLTGGLGHSVATTRSSANSTSIARVQGGSGGRGSGTGFRGADGRVGFARAFASSDSGGLVKAGVVSIGGFGGFGVNGADAGRGANVTLENSAAGATSGRLELSQTIEAGNGGRGDGGGAAGAGGDAHTITSLAYEGESVRVFDRVTAGNAGENYGDGVAANGGHARATAQLSSVGDAELVLSITGGDGGEARSNAISGNGGDAIVEQALVEAQNDVLLAVGLLAGENGLSYGEEGDTGRIVIEGPIHATSTNGGEVEVRVSARSKNANQQGQTYDVILNNVARGDTTGRLMIEQFAVAGDTHMFNSERSNIAANATSINEKSGAFEDLHIETEAAGGDGPSAQDGGTGGHGGHGISISDGENSAGSIFNVSGSRGGNGGSSNGSDGGNGGNATANSNSAVLASGIYSSTAWSNSISGSGGLSSGGRGGDGGLSSSQSIAELVDIGFANADSHAVAGSGGSSSGFYVANYGGRGGDAVSLASAHSALGAARADSEASSGRGGAGAIADGASGIAQSTSIAVGAVSANSTALAESNFNGDTATHIHGGQAVSIARADSLDSMAKATSRSRIFNEVYSIESRALVSANGNFEAQSLTAVHDVSANELHLEPQIHVARLIAVPDSDVMTDLLTGFTDVRDDYDLTGSSQILGFVNMSMANQLFNPLGGMTMSSGMTLEMDTSKIENSQNLLVSLLDMDIGSRGMQDVTFRIFVEGSEVVNESFTSVLEAEAFFTDHTIDLGLISDLAPINSRLDVSLILTSNTFDFDTGFAFRAIIGNSVVDIAAVPVPGAFLLLISAVGFLGGSARVRTTQIKR